MPLIDLAQLVGYVVVVVALGWPLGAYMAKVFTGQPTFASPALGPIERLVYRLCGVDAASEMRWTAYAASMLLFNLVGFAVLFAMLRLQGFAPWNPSGAEAMSTAAAFNTAVSFVSNTNWQAYAGETGVTYLTQMLGLTWQNFVSAASGIAVAVALVRGLTVRETHCIGNFWVDLTRSVVYVLLPLSLVLSLVLAGLGVVQNLGPYTTAKTIEGATQTIAQGPVASQEAIKQLGTNGGGFFNANSAHPFENPTPLTNMLAMVAILVVPAGLIHMFGRMAGDTRQGWVVLSAVVVLFAIGLATIYGLERAGNPNLTAAGADQSAAAGRPGGNMEGKEVRFGIASSSIFANATTAASCGAVNASMSSLTPLAGGMAMLNIALGEVIFGGVGSGLYGILVFAILSVFIAGLMVGRTPEYLGKKVGPKDMKMAMLAVLALEAGILVIAGASAVTPSAVAATSSAGPHGLTEMLYAAASAVGNNGSAFAGLDAAQPWWAYVLGAGMLVGRYLFIVPVLAMAGSMAAKKVSPPSPGTFPTNGPMFAGLLVAVIAIVGALTFFPVFALGPVLEQFLMNAGTLF
jgi:K+-transporting ATPase ATPase A chain